MRRLSLLVFAAAFVLLHVALAALLREPGGTWFFDLPFPGELRLLVVFVDWIPILLAAAALSMGFPLRFPLWLRLGILFLYATALVALAAASLDRSVDESTRGAAETTFYEFLRLLPAPVGFALFADGRHRGGPSRWFGVSLMLFGLWRILYLNVPDLLVIARGGGVLGPTPGLDLYRSFFLGALWEIVYPVLGLLFFYERVPGIHTRLGWGRILESGLRPAGAWTRRGPLRDVRLGSLLFVLNLSVAILLAALLTQAPTGEVGDDSRVFEQITIDLVFLLSLGAGFGEELMFRVILQGGIQRWVAGLVPGHRGPWVGFLVALPVQAVTFAVAHAGYQTLNHLLLPLAFGIFIGIVYRFFGFIPAVMIHTLVDVFAFGDNYVLAQDALGNAAGVSVMLFVLGLLLVLALFGSIAALIFDLLLPALRALRARLRALAAVAAL